MADDIYDLFQKVRQHPDFIAGTIFTTDDLEERQKERAADASLDYSDVDGQMAEAGNDALDWIHPRLDDES